MECGGEGLERTGWEKMGKEVQERSRQEGM